MQNDSNVNSFIEEVFSEMADEIIDLIEDDENYTTNRKDDSREGCNARNDN